MRGEAVWITGVGTVNPLGGDFAGTARSLLEGRSGVRLVTQPDLSQHPSRIAGVIEQIPVPAHLTDLGLADAGVFAELPRWEQVLLACAVRALDEAGLWETRQRLRVGFVLGYGAEWLLSWEGDLLGGGELIMNPALPQECLVYQAAERLQLRGPLTTVAAACASSNFALAQARRWVEQGWVDVCLAGGLETPVTPLAMGVFGNLGAMSRRNDDPPHACRPFDRDRDGLVMGEGGALFVLEPARQARQRGVPAYAEVAGFGASSDAFHMVVPGEDPAAPARAMQDALADAGVTPDAIDYLNAHATSTPVGDIAEARVLQRVLGEAVDRVPVSSVKSMTGHLLSGAAALNAVACLAALQAQAVPPTINLEHPDPECPLCHVACEAQARRVRVAVSNAFGFGGSNTCVVFKAA
jgi:3-oxoacyl-[acyl-carrier-protein] synthase II